VKLASGVFIGSIDHSLVVVCYGIITRVSSPGATRSR
jgi:hypothetical protein